MDYAIFIIGDRGNELSQLINQTGLCSALQHCHRFNTLKQCLASKEDIADIIFIAAEKPSVTSLKTLRKKFPHADLVVFAASDSITDVLDVLRASGDGYILKDTDSAAFLDIINNVAQGGVWMSPILLRKLIQFIGNLSKQAEPAEHLYAPEQDEPYPGVSSFNMFSTTSA